MKKITLLVIAFNLVVFSFLFCGQKTSAAEIVCPNCKSTNIDIEHAEIAEPFCEEEGYGHYRCLDCEYYFKVITTPALGHDWSIEVITPASCTTSGLQHMHCNRCELDQDEVIPATGHSYQETILKKATCLETGLGQYNCSNCTDSYQKEIPALKHNYQIVEDKPATCSQDGITRKVCSNCQDEISETTKALGHDVEFVSIKQVSCTEDGLQEGVCKNCQEKISSKIAAYGHNFPSTWTIEKEATNTEDGLKSVTCTRCGERIEEVIPKSVNVPLIAAIIAVTGISGGSIAYFVLRKSGKIVLKKSLEIQAAKAVLKPLFETKTIMSCIAEDDFYLLLKAQKHLVIKELQYEKILDTIASSKPDLLLIDISSIDFSEVHELVKQINEKHEYNKIALLVSKKQTEELKGDLQQLKDDKQILDYGCNYDDAKINLVKLILPIMKPKLQSNESLKNIAMVAEALGLVGASDIVNLYLKGKSIKNTLSKEGQLKFMDNVSLISNIASILGLSEVSEVTGFISSINTIKNTSKKKIGANEANALKSAGSDIIDFVKDNVDKL